MLVFIAREGILYSRLTRKPIRPPGDDIAMKQTPKIRSKPQTHARAAASPRPNQRRYRALITRALAESDRTYKFITESSPSAILAYDLRGRLLYANPAVQDLTGYTVNDLWESNFINWFHPDDQARMLSVWDNTFEGAKFVEEFRLITKTHQVKWCSSVGGPLCDENGKQIGILERARDITER
ncbi:partial Sensor histidine kinase TmoS, partial [Anaerolineae bacterium]